MTFAQLADERRLSAAKHHFHHLQWNVDADLALQRPPAANVAGLLRQMPRRGLQPLLVSRLLDVFPDRPIERALIAWDVLRGALLGRNDAPLAAKLAAALTPLTEIGVSAEGVAIPRDRIETLVDAARPISDDKLLDDYLALPSLAALVAISRALKTLDDKPAIVAVTLDHVKLLALAHLPTLALAFLQILWARFAAQAALDLMVEVALDARQLDAVPQVEPIDARSAELKAYGLLRAYLAIGDIAAAATLNESIARIPATRDSNALLLPRTELALLQKVWIDAQTIERINAIVPASSDWRYAVQVRESVALQGKPHSAATVIASYTSRFGNSAEMWSRATEHLPARDDLLKRLSRELRYVSWDPEAWRAFGLFTPESDAIYAEIDQRLQSQLESALR